MDMVTQRVEQDNEQNGFEEFEYVKQLIINRTQIIAKPASPRQDDASPEEHIKLRVLPLGTQESTPGHHPVIALRVVPAEGGRQTLTKLNLDLPDTVATEHDALGALCEDYLFEVSLFDSNLKNSLNKRSNKEGVAPLGPGLLLVAKSGESFMPPDSGGNPRARFLEGKRLGQVPLAPFPKSLLELEPVPLDEDPYSFGGLRRIHVRPEESPPSPPLFEDLLVDQGIHTFTGKPGAGKSISTIAIAVRLIQNGKTVAYIDADGNGGRINERLLSMGASQEDLEARFHYYKAAKLDVTSFESLLRVINLDLVVFDNLTNLLSRASVHENDNTAVAGWFNDYAAKVREMGAAALILDHPAKSATGGYARGGSSKLAEEDMAWTITTVENFDKSKVGKVKLKRNKANDGEERPATVIYRIGGTPFVFEREGAAELTEKEQKALEALENGMSYSDWSKAMQEAVEGQEAPEGKWFDHPEKRKRARNGLIEKGRVEEDEDRFYATE